MPPKNKPKKFSIAIYPAINMPIQHAYFNHGKEDEVCITTYQYGMSINYPLSDELIEKIRGSIEEILVNS